MYTRIVRVLRVIALLVSCTLLLAARADVGLMAERGGAPPEDRGELFRVTVVVTDRRGESPAGLQPSDFELLIDGKAHAIETVERADPRAPGARVFAFLLDEFHVDAAGSDRVRDTLLGFVNTHLRPSDLVIAVKPLDSLTSILPTADHDVLRRALATFEGRKEDLTPRTPFEREYMAQAPAAVAAARAQIVTSALRSIAVALAQQEAGLKPAIVLVSDGFGRTRASRDLPASLLAAVRVANRADAPVYAFAPGLVAPQADEKPSPAFDALAGLTRDTGGDLMTGLAALERGLARMSRELDTHYILTWRASQAGDGRFHALKVGIRRDGAQVRARAGFVAPAPAVPARAVESARSLAPRVLRRSALIQSWSGFVPTAADRGLVSITWELAPPRAGTPGRARASRVIVTASAPDGTLLFDAPLAAASSAPQDVPNVAIFEAPHGPVRIDMKILDDKGVVIDTDARDMQPPAARPNLPTIYPPAVLRTRSAREFREISGSARAAPVATRDFRRTDRLILRVPAADAAGQGVPVTAVLLNRWRQPMRPLQALDGSTLPHTTQFDLPLAPLAPGEYSVRITASGPGGDVSEFVSFRVQG